GKALLRIERHDLDLVGVAEHGGRHGAAKIHVQAAPHALRVGRREPGKTRGGAAAQLAALLHDVQRGGLRAGHGAQQQGGADQASCNLHGVLPIGAGQRQCRPVAKPRQISQLAGARKITGRLYDIRDSGYCEYSRRNAISCKGRPQGRNCCAARVDSFATVLVCGVFSLARYAMVQIPISPSSLHRPTEPRQQPPSGWALFALGFRPFYLGGAVFAALAVAIWAGQLAGLLPPPAGSLGLALVWHAHEMVFGFAAVIVVGFLFTAGRAWTGVDTPAGGTLAAFTALWVAGRLAMWAASPPLAALLDGLFLPLAALAFTRVLARAGNRRNYPIALALWVYGAINLAYHFFAWQGDAALALRACVAGLALP